MASLFTVVVMTALLILEVYGRTSNFPAKRLANMAAFDANNNDHSSLEAHDDPFEARYAGSHKENGLGFKENDDSLAEEYKDPFKNNHGVPHENIYDDFIPKRARKYGNNDGILEEREMSANYNGMDDLPDVPSKRAQPRIPCSYCCRFLSCAADYDHICHCSAK